MNNLDSNHPSNLKKTDKIQNEVNEEDTFNEADFYDDACDPAFDDYNDGDFSDFQDNDPAFSDYNPSDNDEFEEDPYDEFKVSHDPPHKQLSLSPTALSFEVIQQQIDNKLSSLAEQLDLDKKQCLLLLRHHKWNSTKILELYFNANQTQNILMDAGVCIDPKPPIQTPNSKQIMIECSVCLDDVSANDTFSIECGHSTVCKPCWIDYLRDAVKTKHCINLTCPQHKCRVIIHRQTWEILISDPYPKEFERYLRFCDEHFIEHSKDYIFCPGRGCDLIYNSEIGVAKEICCVSCSYRFCYKCQNDAHFPASCHMGNAWITKSSSESENIAWILAKTKKCPSCRIHIERNQGCNHMTCRPHVGGCGHEFCWLCKGDWSKHNSSTGGYYACNIYEKNKATGVVDNEEKAQQNASNELERYEFHYTRFDSHQRSREHAVKQKEAIQSKMHEFADKFKWRLSETQFLEDAVSEAIQCWRVLAWTYPVSYYANEIEEETFHLALFSEQQRKLEGFCDGLQEKLDFDLEKLGEIKVRQSVIDYTKAAKKYRNNMVSYIESVLF
eukprot:233181_1